MTFPLVTVSKLFNARFMSEARSDTLHHSYHKSSEQFDYFMMAIITAIVAYIVKEIPPSKLTSVS